MAIADILEAIRAEADAEIERLAREADADAAARRADAEAEAARIEREEIERALARARREAAAIEHRASLSAHRSFAAGREGVYRDLVDALRGRLAGLRASPSWPDVLAALLAEALSEVPDARRVRVDARDVERARAALAGRGDGAPPELAGDLPPEALGGCVVDDGRGRRVANTLSSRLERADPWLRRAFAARVEGEGGEVAG